MKCRRIKIEQGVKNIVWFGSYGKNPDGTAKFYNENNKNDNYSTEQQCVVDSLMQRLSVIKGELWYNVLVGIPLFEKIKRKGLIDSYVISEILKHKDVNQILFFESNIINQNIYSAKIDILTNFGNINLVI